MRLGIKSLIIWNWWTSVCLHFEHQSQERGQLRQKIGDIIPNLQPGSKDGGTRENSPVMRSPWRMSWWDSEEGFKQSERAIDLQRETSHHQQEQWSWENQWQDQGAPGSSSWSSWCRQCRASAALRSASTRTPAATRTSWSLSAPSSRRTAARRYCTTSRWDKNVLETLCWP